MSVLIKDMKMPKSCADCPMLYDGDACYLSGMWNDMRFMLLCSNGHTDEYRLGQFPYKEKRVDWCPLVEVPTPHGRLIDADELLKRLNACKYPVEKTTMRRVTYNAAISDVCRIIDAMPAADVVEVGCGAKMEGWE